MNQSPSPIRLISRPGEDLALKLFANRALAERASSPESLQGLLRPLFPEVRARAQHELAAVGSERIWYVMRDRLGEPRGRANWWRNHDPGRAVLDDAGDFVDVDEEAALLLGMRRAELLGRSGRSFYPPALENWFDDIVPMLTEVGVVVTRWLIYRPDGTTKYVDFRLVEDEAGSHRHGAAFHVIDRVAVEPPAPGTTKPRARSADLPYASRAVAPAVRAAGRDQPAGVSQTGYSRTYTGLPSLAEPAQTRSVPHWALGTS
jgi:PAS domain S-box-containing protein